MNIKRFKASRYELIEVARGRRAADVVLCGGHVINVYSGEYVPYNVAIYKDRIAYVGPREVGVGEQTRIIDVTGKYLSPGFIEPHAHPWVMYNPISLAEKVVPLGTTTIVNDNLFFYLHLGYDGTVEMIDQLSALPLNQLWLARVVSQSEFPEERSWFEAQQVQKLLEHEDVIGTAEITRWPIVYEGDPFAIETVEYAKKLNKISDGHTAGCSYDKLNAIVAAGIDACHEAITEEEALNRLRLGMWTTLRNSSLRPDFPSLLPLVVKGAVDTRRVLMTTDGPNPSYIARNGFVDGLLRQAVQAGVDPMKAVQMVTINAAQYLKLDDTIGGIAPGKRADILVLPDLETFVPERVFIAGKEVAKDGRLLAPLPAIDWNRFISRKPLTVSPAVLQDLRLYRPRADGMTPVIQFISNVITKRVDVALPSSEGLVDISAEPSMLYAALIDRQGKWVVQGIVANFASEIEGMASTYNTTTELLVIGRDPAAMALAAQTVREMGGGIAIAERGAVVLKIELPFLGMMMTDSFEQTVEAHERLLAAVRARGFTYGDLLYALLFLTCDFLPGLRLTPLGLYEVKTGTLVRPREHLNVSQWTGR
ncbi:MAG: amidohydrolase family protein [Hydrogenibacillus schlegelii]|uniref:adenine deaminase n=1 Tax=Hydrogenibacillus schlegelii TaxID=1484 RepID=A0A947CW79_HYDSH|nr:amidohydrolase family protein [Hydrogenibacillus schlegelii]